MLSTQRSFYVRTHSVKILIQSTNPIDTALVVYQRSLDDTRCLSIKAHYGLLRLIKAYYGLVLLLSLTKTYSGLLGLIKTYWGLLTFIKICQSLLRIIQAY